MTRSARRGAVSRLSIAVLGGLVIGAAVALYPVYDRYEHGCGRDGADDIVMVTGEDLNPGRRRHELIKAWNDTFPDRPRARLVELPGGSDQERSELLASQQAGSCDYDVLSLDVVWIAEFIRAGYLERLPVGNGGFDPADFLEKPWRTGTGVDGRQYAVPFYSDVGLLYYRKDIVKDPPRTWEELLEATGSTDQLPDRHAAGLVTQLDDYEGLTVNGMEAIWGAGGNLGDNGDRITLDENGVAGLRRLVSAVSSAQILRESTEFREADAMEAFTSGRALFMRNWPYSYPVLAADEATKDRYGVAELPGPTSAFGPGPGALGGQSLAVSTKARDKGAARQLIQFLTQADRQRELFACGGHVPVRREVYDDIRSCSELRGEPASVTSEEANPLDRAELRAFAAILDEALEHARLRPQVPDYPGFSRAFHRLLHDAIIGHTVPQRSHVEARLTACSGAVPPPRDCP